MRLLYIYSTVRQDQVKVNKRLDDVSGGYQGTKCSGEEEDASKTRRHDSLASISWLQEAIAACSTDPLCVFVDVDMIQYIDSSNRE